MSWIAAAFMDHRTPQQKRRDMIRNWLLIIALIATICASSIYIAKIAREGAIKKAKLYQAYLSDHKCARTGFAGKDALGVYQCDNGLWLSSEIEAIAQVRIDNE